MVDPANPKGIVWLASFPRSGNTWTRVFLTNLRRIVDGDARTLDLNRLDDQFSVSDVAASAFQNVLGRPPMSASPAEIVAARPEVLRKLVEGTKGVVMVKTHNANAVVHGVRLIPPEVSAGAIYVVRNPLDVAISFADFRGVSTDTAIANIGTSGATVATTDEQVFTLSGSWSENVSTWTSAKDPSLLVVRYEDMVDRPAETFGTIARHVLMKHTAEQLGAAIAQSSFATLRLLEETSGFSERPANVKHFFREGGHGQWRDLLTQPQIARVVADHREQMMHFGYLPQ